MARETMKSVKHELGRFEEKCARQEQQMAELKKALVVKTAQVQAATMFIGYLALKLVGDSGGTLVIEKDDLPKVVEKYDVAWEENGDKSAVVIGVRGKASW